MTLLIIEFRQKLFYVWNLSKCKNGVWKRLSFQWGNWKDIPSYFLQSTISIRLVDLSLKQKFFFNPGSTHRAFSSTAHQGLEIKYWNLPEPIRLSKAVKSWMSFWLSSSALKHMWNQCKFFILVSERLIYIKNIGLCRFRSEIQVNAKYNFIMLETVVYSFIK